MNRVSSLFTLAAALAISVTLPASALSFEISETRAK